MLSLSDFTSVVNQLLPAGLLNGILFGTKAQLAPTFKTALIRSGTLHIVALSGMNITILMTITASTLLRIFSRRITSLLTVLIIMGFIWFVGLSPSVIRAAIMGCLSLLSTIFGRQKGALWCLLLAALGMLILNLSYLTDVSFQLSFLATLGIILFTKSNKKEINPSKFFLCNLIKDDLKTTLYAQVFTMPIFIFTFHQVSLMSPVPNILIGRLI